MKIATTKLYLDCRRLRADGTASLLLGVCWRGSTRYIMTGIALQPEHWDAKACSVVYRRDAARLNIHVERFKADVDGMILRLFADPAARQLSATALKERIEMEMLPEEERGADERELFRYNFLAFANAHSDHTRRLYMHTFTHVERFVGAVGMRTLRFEDINREWLVRFDRYLARTAPSANARAVHLRNIRAVFNYAIDNDVTAVYPFRKFQIKQEETRKRSLTVEQLRQLRDYPCEEYQERYRDIFMLMFYLIGINAADLFLAGPDALRAGRLEYRRAKTGRLYSIKVEPEAMAIIKKYHGKNYLLSVMDEYLDYRNFIHRMGIALKKIGVLERVGHGGKKIITPLFPDLSGYWARHTWATLAAELEIPVETISHALGHSIGSSTTAIYIKFNEKKVDEANRKVIDYVNGKNNVD